MRDVEREDHQGDRQDSEHGTALNRPHAHSVHPGQKAASTKVNGRAAGPVHRDRTRWSMPKEALAFWVREPGVGRAPPGAAAAPGSR